MAFSAVFQWLPGDKGGLNRFLLEHYVEHQTFYKTLLDQATPVKSINYPIQKIGAVSGAEGMDNWPDWLWAHQAMSQSVWSGLGGGQSADFGSVKYQDPVAMQDWMQRHAAWHAVVRQSLGL